MFGSTFLPQIYSKLCICLQDSSRILRLLLAAVSINGLMRNNNCVRTFSDCEESQLYNFSAVSCQPLCQP